MTQAFTIDDERMKKRLSMDISKPQTAGEYPVDGLPVKPIPHLEFPRVIYKHPKEPFKVIIHRNAKHEVVDEERIPAEHLTKVVSDKKELEAALKAGWVLQPFVPTAPPDPNDGLYS